MNDGRTDVSAVSRSSCLEDVCFASHRLISDHQESRATTAPAPAPCPAQAFINCVYFQTDGTHTIMPTRRNLLCSSIETLWSECNVSYVGRRACWAGSRLCCTVTRSRSTPCTDRPPPRLKRGAILWVVSGFGRVSPWVETRPNTSKPRLSSTTPPRTLILRLFFFVVLRGLQLSAYSSLQLCL